MNKQQLANTIWAAANKMRSKIEANEYKDYILGFIFYKFLSDREEQVAREAGADAETIKNEFVETNANSVKFVQDKLGYFISYKNLFSTWIDPNSDFDVSNVRDALSSFARLIAPSHKKVFSDVFKTLESGLSKLGEDEARRTKAIKDLLKLIRDIPTDGRQDYDVLGFIYEYLIGMFAANAGKKAGEFYTPHEVALFMAEIVADHLKDREQIEIYDPTSGSGSLLINIGKAVSRRLNGPNNVKYYAQELKENTFNLTRMNLVMRGILPANIEVRNDDTLDKDWPYFDESDPENTYAPLFVDAVVSNPPYSQHWTSKGHESDPRYAGFGVAPKSKADYAFLLHDLYHLRDDGIMTIVLPHGVLFRGKKDDGSEWSIRRGLVEGNHIAAIIGLPSNIFFGTGIPTIVMVLRKHRAETETLIVDASRGFVKDGKKNKLRAADIQRIVDTVIGRRAVLGYSRLVTRDEIRANDYNLNIPRYIAHNENESWDIRSIMFGGIPMSELDALKSYWDEFTGLRQDAFEVDGNYAKLKSGVIENHASVAEYAQGVNAALAGFDDYLKTVLIDRWDRLVINTQEAELASNLFGRLESVALVDPYEAYQILDDEWKQTSVDLEILQSEGFDAVRKVDPNMVMKKKGDEEVEEQKGWVGRIIPFELVQERFFAAERAEIAEKTAAADRLASELVTLAGDVPEEEREGVIEEEGEEFDAKLVAAKAVEIRADVETPETAALEAYLALATDNEKKDFTAAHPEVAWSQMRVQKKGTYAKKEIQGRLSLIRSQYAFEEDSFEALVLKADELIRQEKTIRSEIKALEKTLEAKTIEKIKTLTDAEAKELLERKWVTPVYAKLCALPQMIVDGLIQKVKALSDKYAVTLTDVSSRVNVAEKELAGFIDELTGTPDDLEGLAAWRKELAK